MCRTIYTKSIENIINIPLFTFRFKSVFTTDTLVKYCHCFSYLKWVNRKDGGRRVDRKLAL